MNIEKTIKELGEILTVKLAALSLLLREYKLAARETQSYKDVSDIKGKWDEISILYEEIKPMYEFINKHASFAKQAVKSPLKLELAYWRHEK